MSDLSDLGPLVRPASLHESVAARLRALIFERQLAPGALIDELALAREWGISRTPLREALKVLASEGLVHAQPRRGCVVTEISEDDARQLFPVMALLEGRCAYEAARNATDAELVELEGLHAQLEHHAASGDTDGYYRANHVFHTRVQQLARNPWLSRATDQLRIFMRLLRGRQLHLPGRMDASIGEHRALIAALLARDARAAQREMHDHLMAQLDALQALRAAESGARPAAARPAARRPTRSRR
ncbi:GntR family transcriptional regulator [Caldimonas sp. KR1-144]|uniref:GntR family transcriptional regulator n=1 Tax=Caldimonas sp. KR1-144 TaxID=3400911 RepID=UPI003BFAFF26